MTDSEVLSVLDELKREVKHIYDNEGDFIENIYKVIQTLKEQLTTTPNTTEQNWKRATMENKIDQILREVISINQSIDGEIWHMPDNALDDARAAILSLIDEAVREARLDELNRFYDSSNRDSHYRNRRNKIEGGDR